jgi:hypothetical protein
MGEKDFAFNSMLHCMCFTSVHWVCSSLSRQHHCTAHSSAGPAQQHTACCARPFRPSQPMQGQAHQQMNTLAHPQQQDWARRASSQPATADWDWRAPKTGPAAWHRLTPPCQQVVYKTATDAEAALPLYACSVVQAPAIHVRHPCPLSPSTAPVPLLSLPAPPVQYTVHLLYNSLRTAQLTS